MIEKGRWIKHKLSDDQKLEIINCWNSINFEHVFNCISSMECCICDVINNNGGHIKY